MGIYKRPDSPYWWVRHGQLRESTGTTDKHKALLYEAALIEKDKTGDGKQRRFWEEATSRWITENAGKRSLKSDMSYIRWLDKHLAGLYLDEIDASLVRLIRISREHEAHAVTGKRVSESTVAHHMQMLRSILRKARDEWDWVDKIPKIKISTPKNKRERWLTQKEAATLINELPKYLADAAMFTLQTGLRAGNLCSLQWDMIDFSMKVIRFPASKMKNGNPLTVPLNAVAMDVLMDRWEEMRTGYVFTKNGSRITNFSNKEWRDALERANIKDFRWHDLRHTWASWHAMLGTEMHELQQLGGWSSLDLVLRYSHLSLGHLSNVADALGKETAQWSWLTKSGGNISNAQTGGR